MKQGQKILKKVQPTGSWIYIEIWHRIIMSKIILKTDGAVAVRLLGSQYLFV